MNSFAKYIDHTNLKPNASKKAIMALCKEAKDHHFFSVCVNPSNVALCVDQLRGSSVKVCTVIGFPLGATSSEAKVCETQIAIAQGAQEIDMVINVARLQDKDNEYVLEEIKQVIAQAQGRVVKVIIETCLLSNEEKVRASQLAEQAGAHFVKTSTGFSTGGATLEDVSLIRSSVSDKIGIKASGGIRNNVDFKEMLLAGATRIGTSNGIAILGGKNGTLY